MTDGARRESIVIYWLRENEEIPADRLG